MKESGFMHEQKKLIISEVRSFSRFYTNIIGLLNEGILDSPYSLTEVRVLLEIKKIQNCTANILIDKLNIDRGYMSRILNRFESNDLITKENSSNDGRVLFLNLTSKGKNILRELEERSNNQVENLINPLSESDYKRLVDSLRYIKSALSQGLNSIKVRKFNSTDIQYIINRHRELYKIEYGFTSEFSDYVEIYVTKFNDHYDETKENIWIAESDGEPIGVIAIVKIDNSSAQLRWFLIEPEMRGKGLGSTLMKTAIDFCKEKNYKHVLLWTVNVLETARHLYKSYGFNLTESLDNNTWTNHLVKEERWDLYL